MAAFAKKVVELNLFNDYLELAYQQAYWQFCNALELLEVQKSSQQAKENSVLSLIYINFTRMVLSQMLNGPGDNILSKDFLNKMAKITSDDEMHDLVVNHFKPLIKAPNEQENVNFPSFTRGFDASNTFAKWLAKNVSNFD